MHTTNKTEQILANLGETKRTWRTGQNWAKPGKKLAFLGKNKAKRGKKRAKSGKTGQKRAKKRENETKLWQNRAKPKVSQNFGLGSPLPVPDFCNANKQTA